MDQIKTKRATYSLDLGQSLDEFLAELERRGASEQEAEEIMLRLCKLAFLERARQFTLSRERSEKTKGQIETELARYLPFASRSRAKQTKIKADFDQLDPATKKRLLRELAESSG